MHNDKDLTYSEAIEQVMLNNGFYAPLKLLYEQIWKYKNKRENWTERLFKSKVKIFAKERCVKIF
jgi:hypothetical protein